MVTAAMALVALGCGQESEEAAPVARPIKTLSLGGDGGHGVLEYPGSLRAVQESDLGFEVAGKIMDLPIEEGQRVDEGALLAKLDPRDYESRLRGEEANLAAARADFDRAKRLFEADVASEQDLDVNRRNFEVARSQVETAQKALEDTVLRAPFAGTVARKHVIDFANVEAKQPVVHLVDDSALDLVASVPERDIASVNRDLSPAAVTARTRPRVRLPALPGRTFEARLTELSQIADPVTRTFEARFRFDPPSDARILPGMTGRVVLQLAPDSRLALGQLIPAQAVLGDETGASYVWVVDPGSLSVSRRAVELGELTGSDVEIRAGLDGTEEIAVSGVSHLREGMTVRRLAN